MGSTYCLVVDGPLPAGVGDLLSGRFEGVRIYPAAVHTVIECSVSDQSALRSLLTQVWDVGGTVLLLADVTSGRKGWEG
jgi:hypothetical protein